jgi:hypothetical protein
VIRPRGEDDFVLIVAARRGTSVDVEGAKVKFWMAIHDMAVSPKPLQLRVADSLMNGIAGVLPSQLPPHLREPFTDLLRRITEVHDGGDELSDEQVQRVAEDILVFYDRLEAEVGRRGGLWSV